MGNVEILCLPKICQNSEYVCPQSILHPTICESKIVKIKNTCPSCFISIGTSTEENYEPFLPQQCYTVAISFEISLSADLRPFHMYLNFWMCSLLRNLQINSSDFSWNLGISSFDLLRVTVQGQIFLAVLDHWGPLSEKIRKGFSVVKDRQKKFDLERSL